MQGSGTSQGSYRPGAPYFDIFSIGIQLVPGMSLYLSSGVVKNVLITDTLLVRIDRNGSQANEAMVLIADMFL